MIALLMLLSLALALPQEQAPQTDLELLARWREDFELDELAHILKEGPALVSPEGRLAKNGAALALVARALYAAGREGTALNLLRTPPPLDADGQMEVELALAEFALARDDLEGVLDLVYDRARQLPRQPAYADAWWLAAQALTRGGAIAEARPLLQRLVELAPHASTTPAAYHLLAQAALQQGEREQAAHYRTLSTSSAKWQALLRARRIQIRQDPQASLPRLGLAQLWFEVREFATARSLLLELVALDAKEARAYALLGECERHLGAMPAARAAWDRALELDPQHLAARFNRAILARMEGRVADAQADFRWIVEHGAADPLRQERAQEELRALSDK